MALMAHFYSISRRLLLTGILVALTSAQVHAFPFYRTNFFNAYPSAVGTVIEDLPSNDAHCGVCHYRFGGGGNRNPYGTAVEATNKSVAAILALGSEDSDGDGFTNDEEILGLLTGGVPSFPGLTPDNVDLVSFVDIAEIEDFLVPNVAVATHNEATDGDLSDDRLAPTAFVLTEGDNTFIVDQQGDAQGRDIDYITVEIPDGLELSSIVLDDYVAGVANQAFLGLQVGSAFTVDASAATAGDLLGGMLYGSAQIGQDILPDIGQLAGAAGFTPPLPAGHYTFWLNQTENNSRARLNLIVSEIIVTLPMFRRGDATTTGGVDITDAIVTLELVILGLGSLNCEDAADSNDDGMVDITDAIVTLQEVILGQQGIKDPGPNMCGIDPDETDNLGCDSFPDCQ